jgi:hypothetical protein
METTIRNSDLDQLAALLRKQHTRKIDLVTPATKLAFADGRLQLTGLDMLLDEDGFTDPNGAYDPTKVFDEGLASRFRIPSGYVTRMRSALPDLWSQTMAAWAGHAEHRHNHYLLRLFRGEDGNGVARAFLSDVYKPIDNFDVLVAALDGIRKADVDARVDTCDLSERRMRVRVVCPSVVAMAPKLLAGYRPGFDLHAPRAGGWTLERALRAAADEGLGYEPGSEPVVFGGFEIGNSETGNGKFTITPRLVVKVCRNGLTLETDGFGTQHLGARLQAGKIDWSTETLSKNLAVVTSQTADVVREFCDPRYVQAKVTELEAGADAKVTSPDDTIRLVSKTLRYPQEVTDLVLSHFIGGGQCTAGGVLNAVTSTAQFIDNPDLAASVEASAVRAMQLAANAG